MKGEFRYVIAVLAGLTLVSCREELCYNHFGAADIDFKWSVNQDPSDTESPAPSGVTALVYDASGQPTEMFVSPDGGNVNFGENGMQSLLLYNNDTESVLIAGESEGPQSVYATSTAGSRMAPEGIRKLHPDEAVLNPPDMLYAAYVETQSDVGNHEVMDIKIDMTPLVFTYEVSYEFEHGFNRVTDARGAMSGMARWVYLYNGMTMVDPAILVYDCKLSDNAVTAKVMSFGTPGYIPVSRKDGESHGHTLNLEVILVNGKTKEFNFDITGQLSSQPRGGKIVVSGLRIEDKESNSDSGFDVDMDDWGNNEDIDLPVGGQQ